MTCKPVILSLAVACLTAPCAQADWTPGQPYKWLQLPDLTPNGIAINATSMTVADDWLCTDLTPVKDIHFWGGWLNNAVFAGPVFKLSIYQDVPAVIGQLPSHPGNLLWSRDLAPTASRIYAEEPFGEFFWTDPVTSQTLFPAADNAVWQYNFTLDPADYFYQQGSPAAPVVYWLAIQAILPQGANQVFGWKTRDPADGHFNDDAVWSTTNFTSFNDLSYPSGFAYNGSIDMAFVITPEPASLGLLGLGIMALLHRRR